MKIAIVAFTLCFAVVIVASSTQVPIVGLEGANVVPGSYIIRFKDGIQEAQRGTHFAVVSNMLKKDQESAIEHTYDLGKFKGYAAKLSAKSLASIRAMTNDIEYIEANQVARKFQSCATQSDAVWGLDRISEVEIFLDGNYHYTGSAGSGVDAYIIDTGVLITHDEFQGRAYWGANFADDINQDCDGHGTHVAGTVGGKTYGVAKDVTIFAVKVLGCDGSGTYAGVISGIQWAANQAKSRKRPSVANMSLGGGYSASVNDAVAAAIESGVTFAVAAGNENTDACDSSPASEPSAITVGATTIDDDVATYEDTRCSFSNYGTCVSIFAPGELIKSAWIGSNNATLTISGTSMASPHVAGAVALYLGDNPTATPEEIKSHFTTSSTHNIIDLVCPAGRNGGICLESPNILLYKSC